MSAAGVGELHFIERKMNSNMYCEILQQSKILSLKDLINREVFQHDNDPKHTSKTEEGESKGDRLAKHVSRLEPNRTPFLKRKVEVCKVSNIHQLHDVIMEEWKSIPVATCKALVNSMPRRVKTVLDNDGGHTKYWQLTWFMLILTTLPKECTHFCWQRFSF